MVGPLEAERFGRIAPSILTQLLALVKHGQCTERYEYSLTATDIQTHWKGAVEALRLAADTFLKNMGVLIAVRK